MDDELEGGPTVLAVPSPATDRLIDVLVDLDGVTGSKEAPATPPDAGWRWDWDTVLSEWRDLVAVEPPRPQMVVSTWPERFETTALTDLTPEGWRAQVEWPTALWFTTLVAAAERVADGGALVAVVERPATLDGPAHGATVAVADGVANLVRSLAAAHGPRGVRVNAVATALHTAPASLSGAPPKLSSFPGSYDDVAGAVRLLLSPDASGVTATTLAADCGRR